MTFDYVTILPSFIMLIHKLIFHFINFLLNFLNPYSLWEEDEILDRTMHDWQWE